MCGCCNVLVSTAVCGHLSRQYVLTASPIQGTYEEVQAANIKTLQRPHRPREARPGAWAAPAI